MDIARLLMLYDLIPPRMPRGSPQNQRRIGASARFKAYAKSQGLSFREALKLCREKKGSAGTSLST